LNPRLPRAKAWFDLVRVFNLPIPLAGMLAGAYSSPVAEPWRLLIVLVAAMLGCAVTQSYNDYEDRDVDKVNAPFRPLPSGRLAPKSVLLGGHGLALVGALMSLAAEPLSVPIVFGTFLLTRYYPRAKKVTLANHLMMPAALALTPLYGSLVVHGRLNPLAIVSSAAILLGDINMNVVGSFKDLWDRSAQERVLPVVVGARAAVVIALGCGLAGLGLQASAVALGWAGGGALVPLAAALTLTLVSRARLYREPTAKVGYAALQMGRLSECMAFPALVAGVLPFDHAVGVIGCCVFVALYTQTIIPENILPDEASATIGGARGAAAVPRSSETLAAGQVEVSS
jgi:4-hydroxybenzoate polyprenyltransferase